MRVREIWKFVLKQRLSFWMISFYLFMEYVRPQQIYPEIDILPWAQIFIHSGCSVLPVRGIRNSAVAYGRYWALLRSSQSY